MPVRYSSDLAEHHAVRTAAGVFDLSHMAEVGVTGPQAVAFLDHALAGSFGAMPVGRAKYSLLLAEDGGILDDLVVYRTGEDVFLVVANAANRSVAVDALTARAAGFDVAVSDDSDSTALVAIQGPAAAGTLDALVVADRLQPETPLDELRYYGCSTRCSTAPRSSSPARATGEDGFEIYSDTDVATAIWDALLDAGADRGSSRRGSPRATRSGSRPACRCTGTSSTPPCVPPRPDSAGSSRPRARSSGTPVCSPPTTPGCSSDS